MQAKWSHRQSRPDLQRAMLTSSCWTMTPKRKPWESNPQAASMPPPAFQAGSSAVRMASITIGERKSWDSNPQAAHWPPPVFKTGSSSGRMTSVRKAAGAGLEPGTAAKRWSDDVQSVASCRWMIPHCFHRRHAWCQASSGRRSRTSASWFKARRPTSSRSPRVACGSRTRLAGLEVRHLCRSAKTT